MDLLLFITGLVQITLSLLIGVLLLYWTSKIFQKLIRGINENEELRKNNIAVSILNASIILALIIVVKNSVDTAITIFSNTIRNPTSVFFDYFESALLMLGHIVLSGILAFSSIYFAMNIFMWLTKNLDELNEIKQNNVAVSIMFGVIIISIALLLEPGIKTILDSLIPFPPVSLMDIG